MFALISPTFGSLAIRRAVLTIDRLLPAVVLFAAYLLTAAAGYSGYFLKWAFRDGGTVSYLSVAAGTAPRPFVYRQLLPLAAHALVSVLPAEKLRAMERSWVEFSLGSMYVLAKDSAIAATAVDYRVAYLLAFGCFLAALFGLRRLCLHATGSRSASTAAPMLFALIYPVLMTRGGYFYDPVELLMLVVAALFVVNGWWLALIALSPLAALNKESYFFFLFALLPLVPDAKRGLMAYASLAACTAIALGVYLLTSRAFSQNSGGATEFHLLANASFYTRLSSYFGYETTYGLPLPRGVSFFNVIVIASVLKWGWPRLPANWRRHASAALTINLPLFAVLLDG